MMKRSVLPLLLLILLFTNASSQIIRSKLDFVGGIAYPEYIHGGLRYQYSDITQLGVYYGGDMGIKPEIIRTWTGDNFIHFGKHAYTPNRPVWYARQGFTYSIHTTADQIFRYSFIDVAAGREFGFNNWIGINADMGLLARVREKIEYKDGRSDPSYLTSWEWKPLLRFQIFISI